MFRENLEEATPGDFLFDLNLCLQGYIYVNSYFKNYISGQIKYQNNFEVIIKTSHFWVRPKHNSGNEDRQNFTCKYNLIV